MKETAVFDNGIQNAVPGDAARSTEDLQDVAELYPILFRTGEALAARYAADPLSRETDLGSPLTVEARYGNE